MIAVQIAVQADPRGRLARQSRTVGKPDMLARFLSGGVTLGARQRTAGFDGDV